MPWKSVRKPLQLHELRRLSKFCLVVLYGSMGSVSPYSLFRMRQNLRLIDCALRPSNLRYFLFLSHEIEVLPSLKTSFSPSGEFQIRSIWMFSATKHFNKVKSPTHDNVMFEPSDTMSSWLHTISSHHCCITACWAEILN